MPNRPVRRPAGPLAEESGRRGTRRGHDGFKGRWAEVGDSPEKQEMIADFLYRKYSQLFLSFEERLRTKVGNSNGLDTHLKCYLSGI